jgi:hypothetical protein
MSSERGVDPQDVYTYLVLGREMNGRGNPLYVLPSDKPGSDASVSKVQASSRLWSLNAETLPCVPQKGATPSASRSSLNSPHRLRSTSPATG